MNKKITAQKIKLHDKNYPSALKSLINKPEFLYVRGNILETDIFAVATVGTRNPTESGKRTARLFSHELARSGFAIVSGGARGIDTIAHEEAIKVGGRTIAVLGCGIDVVYPRENEALYEKIANNGALISTFPPGTPPFGKNFLDRNSLISGLSLAVLVVEGTKRSGTFSIASRAANQGKEVFAVPGPRSAPQSYTPNFLIDQGASIAESPFDILSYLKSII